LLPRFALWSEKAIARGARPQKQLFLYIILIYWPDKDILDGSRTPPKVEIEK
jgi:hypothetical protein